MSGAANFPIVAGSAWPSSGRGVAPVEKACNTNGLHGDKPPHPEPPGGGFRRIGAEKASRFDTGAAPGWHGPRLRAPFVAQVLAQVLFTPEPDVAAARAAYGGSPNIPSGILCDRSA